MIDFKAKKFIRQKIEELRSQFPNGTLYDKLGSLENTCQEWIEDFISITDLIKILQKDSYKIDLSAYSEQPSQDRIIDISLEVKSIIKLLKKNYNKFTYKNVIYLDKAFRIDDQLDAINENISNFIKMNYPQLKPTIRLYGFVVKKQYGITIVFIVFEEIINDKKELFIKGPIDLIYFKSILVYYELFKFMGNTSEKNFFPKIIRAKKQISKIYYTYKQTNFDNYTGRQLIIGDLTIPSFIKINSEYLITLISDKEGYLGYINFVYYTIETAFTKSVQTGTITLYDEAFNKILRLKTQGMKLYYFLLKLNPNIFNYKFINNNMLFNNTYYDYEIDDVYKKIISVE